MEVTKQMLGKVCIAPRGVYSGSTQYYPLDLVTYGNAAYIAKQNTKGAAPTNATYWQLICSGGAGSPALNSADILCWPST